MSFRKYSAALIVANVGAVTVSEASVFDIGLQETPPNFINAAEHIFEVDGIELTVTGLSRTGNPVNTNRNVGGIGVLGNGLGTINASETLVLTFDSPVVLTEVVFNLVDDGDEFILSVDSGDFTDPADVPSVPFETNFTDSATTYAFSAPGDANDTSNSWRIISVTVIPEPAALAVGLPALLLATRRRRSA